MKIKLIYCSGKAIIEESLWRNKEHEGGLSAHLRSSKKKKIMIERNSQLLSGLINRNNDLAYQVHIVNLPESLPANLDISEDYTSLVDHFGLIYAESLPKNAKYEINYYSASLSNQKYLTETSDEEIINLYEQIHKTVVRYPKASIKVEAYFAEEIIKHHIYEYFNKHNYLLPEQVALSLFTKSDDSFSTRHENSIVGCGLVDFSCSEKIAEYRQVKSLNLMDDEIDFAFFVNYFNQKNIYKINLAPINDLLLSTKKNGVVEVLRRAALVIQIKNVGSLSNNQLNEFVKSLTRLANTTKQSNNESLDKLLYRVMEQCVIILRCISDQRCTLKNLFNQHWPADVLNAAWLPGINDVLDKISALIENKHVDDYSDLLDTIHKLNCFYKKYYWGGMALVCAGLTLVFATPALLSIILPTVIAFTSYSFLLTTMTYGVATLVLLSGIIKGALIIQAGCKALKIASNESSLKKDLFYSIRNLKLFFPLEEKKRAETLPPVNAVDTINENYCPQNKG